MLTRVRLENFKSWEDTGEVPLKPITGFFGPNSSGKSSLLQSLLLMKQTDDSPDRGVGLHFGDEKTLVDLGDFESVIHKHDTERTLKFSLGWDARLSAEQELVIPDDYGGGTVVEGDYTGFELEVGELSRDSKRSLILERVSYQVADGREFGLRRLPSQEGHAEFPGNSTFERKLPKVGFHRLPYYVTDEPEAEDFFLALQFELTMVLRNLYYLGPFRANPRRIYAWSGAQPLNMGPAGEYVVDAMLAFRQQGDGVIDEPDADLVAIDEYVAGWLKRLSLVHDFRVEALATNRRIFEVKVQQSIGSPEVLLADVGFGVSQILPVLVLCFYVPLKSTLILDHPDIHLHPSAQAGLADVFIDAWKKHAVQILFESHSEHLLRRLQRRIAERTIDQDDVSLFFCSTDGSGGSTLSQLNVDEFGNISNWPKDFFGDQFGEIAAISEATMERAQDSQ